MAAAGPAGHRHPPGPDRPPPRDAARAAPARRGRRPARRALDDDLVRARTAEADVQREVAKADSDVQLVRDRSARNQARLMAGQGTAKDMQALQHELDSLTRRQAELEDIELEVMERAEALAAAVAELEAAAGRARRPDRRARPPPATGCSPELEAEAATVGPAARRRRRRCRRRPGRALREDPRLQRRHRRGRAAPAPLRGLPARAQPGRHQPHPRRRRRRGAALRGVPPHPRAHRRVRPLTPVAGRRLVVEADGGSRGNPGKAGYGALVRDAGDRAGARRARRLAWASRATTSRSTPGWSPA